MLYYNECYRYVAIAIRIRHLAGRARVSESPALASAKLMTVELVPEVVQDPAASLRGRHTTVSSQIILGSIKTTIHDLPILDCPQTQHFNEDCKVHQNPMCILTSSAKNC